MSQPSHYIRAVQCHQPIPWAVWQLCPYHGVQVCSRYQQRVSSSSLLGVHADTDTVPPPVCAALRAATHHRLSSETAELTRSYLASLILTRGVLLSHTYPHLQGAKCTSLTKCNVYYLSSGLYGTWCTMYLAWLYIIPRWIPSVWHLVLIWVSRRLGLCLHKWTMLL